MRLFTHMQVKWQGLLNMIFNSLGSNYDFEYVIKSLFGFSSNTSRSKLVSFLDNKYQGKTILLYKGREAIKLALNVLKLPKGSRVGITGFTCFAVYQAVKEAGCVPEYIDIEDRTLNFTVEELAKHKSLKVIIVQNTLGNACDIEDILSFCKRNKVYLIEDMAHSVGINYKNKKEVGTCGDFTAMSFSQDKMLDAVSGGALVVRNRDFQGKLKEVNLEDLSIKKQVVDRFYPLFTFLIRKTYGLGVGKLLHFILKRLKLLSQPMPEDGRIRFHSLPGWYCALVIYQFSRMDETLKHRRKIIETYKDKIQSKAVGIIRFPIFIDGRDKLIKYLGRYGVYISDVWYDAQISPRRYLKLTDYEKGECPISEKISNEIVNLPTHKNVSEKDALFIASKINQWLNMK